MNETVEHLENRVKLNQNSVIYAFLILASCGMGSMAICWTSVDKWSAIGKSICLVFLVFLLIKGFQEPMLINPYLLFCILPISLIVYDARVSERYLDNLELTTWITIVLNFFMLFLAFYLTKPYCRINAKEWGFSIYDDISSGSRARFHFWVTLIIGMLPTIYGAVIGYEDLLNANIYAMRNYVNMFPAASLLKFFQYFAIVCAFKMKKKRYIAVGISAQVIATMFLFSKSELMFLILVVAVSWLKYYKVKINMLSICILFMLVAAVFLWAFDFYDAMRTEGTESMIDRLINRGDVYWEGPRVLAMPYMYLVQGWNNLQYVMQTQAEHTYGLWLLNPILHYLPVKFNLVKELEAPSFFNTFTYLGVQFKDFGIVGSSGVSFLLGVWIKKIYTMFLSSESPVSTCVYAINALAVFQMFFSNHYFMVLYPITICILFLIYDILFLKFKL